MKKIGLFGESPNDTKAVKEILSKKYSGKFEFEILLPRITGSMLDNRMARLDLAIEYKLKKPDYVVVVRDLDSLNSDFNKLCKLYNFFIGINKTVEGKGIFLLSVYELETLIISEVDAFNDYYGTAASFPGDPMLIEEPKEILKNLTTYSKKKYTPGHCPDVFRMMDFDKLVDNCMFFKDFIHDFESHALA
ncbi:hypothetical protein GCM10027346_20590 [Hymenobacter seoulensis]